MKNNHFQTSSNDLSTASKKHLAFKNFLKLKGWHFRYDTVRNRLMSRDDHGRYQQLNDKLLLDIIRSEFGGMSLEYMTDTLMSPLISKPYNPLKYWLSQLKRDNETDYINELCSYSEKLKAAKEQEPDSAKIAKGAIKK